MKTRILIPLLLLAAVLVFFRAPLFEAGMGVPWDLPGYHLPQVAFLSESLQAGRIPYWEPYAYCGRPFAANVQTQTFYPPRVLTALVAPVGDADQLYYLLEIEEVAHVFLAAVFACWLALQMGASRPGALLAGFAYALGCFFASQAEHIGAVEAATWLPLALAAVWMLREGWRPRSFLLLTGSLAMATLAGFTPVTIAVFLAALLFAAALAAAKLARPALMARAFAGMAAAAGLCAFLLIPAALLSLESVARYRYEWRGTGGGLPLAALWSMVSPNHLGIFDLSTYKAPYEPTQLYLYCGLLALALAIAAAVWRRSRETAALAALLAVSGVWMFGDSTPVGAWVFAALPVALQNAFYPHALMAVFSLMVAVLAGLGATRLLRSQPVAYGVALLCAVELIAVGSRRPFNAAPVEVTTERSLEGQAEPIGSLHKLVVANPQARIDTVDAPLPWALAPALTRLPIANGYDPQALTRFIQARLAVANGKRWGAYYQAERPESPMLSAMSVRYLISRKPVPALREVGEYHGQRVYENPNVLPRFYFVSRVTAAQSMSEAAALTRRATWNPAEEAIVEAPQLRAQSYAAGQISNLRYESNSVAFDADAPAAAFVASSEAHYPGWKAYVDGQETPIYYTNATFRGIALPAGRHHVEMRYSPVVFGYSALVSLAALIALGIVCRRRKASPSAFARASL